MTQWWSYGLSDFLMFSPQAWWRLVARYNQAWWPAQALGIVAALALLLLLRQPGLRWQRAAMLLLALGSGWVGWAFHLQRYAEIFLAAPWAGGAWLLQAVLLLAAALSPVRPAEARPVPPGAWLLLAAALFHPLLAPATGHPWTEAEVFGFMPEPTALGTLGALLALQAWPRWSRLALAVLPALSLLLGAATRWLIALA